MQGFEFDVLVNVCLGWSVFGLVGFNDSEIDDFDGSGCFVGNEMLNNVCWMLNIGIQFLKFLNDFWVFVGCVDVEFCGKQYWYFDNFDVQDEFIFFNVWVSFDYECWLFILWGKNFIDEDFYVEYFDVMWGGILLGMDFGYCGCFQLFGVDVCWCF